MAQSERNGAERPATISPLDLLHPASWQMAGNAVMRANMELMSLASRRARSHVELPNRVMGCRTAIDLGHLQAGYWSEALQDYAHCGQRMMALWLHTMQAFGQGQLARQGERMAHEMADPFVHAAEETAARMAEAPAEPWEWWRTDMKGIKPSRLANGHHPERS